MLSARQRGLLLVYGVILWLKLTDSMAFVLRQPQNRKLDEVDVLESEPVSKSERSLQSTDSIANSVPLNSLLSAVVISSNNSRERTRTDHERLGRISVPVTNFHEKTESLVRPAGWDKLGLLDMILHNSLKQSTQTNAEHSQQQQPAKGAVAANARKKRSHIVYYGWEVGKKDDEDVPLIKCPENEEMMELYPCPSPTYSTTGGAQYICIDERALCNRRYDCPGKEDEDPTICMFHKLTLNLLSSVGTAVFQLSRTLF